MFFLEQNDKGGNKVKEEKAFFKVKGNKFWILEQKSEAAKGERGEYGANSWVFNNENDAILKMKDLLSVENLDFSKLDELAESISKRYNLQEVEIAKDKYNMKAISWLKVALLGFSQK